MTHLISYSRFRSLRIGATLAEIMLGIAIFSIFVFGVLGVLGQSAHLNRRDREVNQVNSLTQGYLEQCVMKSRSKVGYTALVDIPLTPADDPAYVYAVDVTPDNPLSPPPGHIPHTKKIAVMLYYHDDHGGPTAIAPLRPHGGLALCLSTRVEEPLK